MKHLIIFAHPNNENSFNKAILEETLKASEKLAVETEVRDLYTLDFDPILSWKEIQGSHQQITPSEVQYEQKLIDKADLITMIYPLWWMGFPAILKGYLDRILSHGFAYKTENGQSVGLLHGKSMQQFITIGSNLECYQSKGFDKSLCDCLVDGLFNYCGITDIKHSFFDDIHTIADADRKLMLEDIFQKTLKNLTALADKNQLKK